MAGLADATGEYVLVMKIDRGLQLEVGRLGQVWIPPGWALYVGSARGPGGVRARLRRHAKPAELKRHHWHIDYLTAAAPIQEFWCHTGETPLECRWAELMSEMGQPIARFGSSDCHCKSHLFTMDTFTRVKIVWAALAKDCQAGISRVSLQEEHA